MAERNKIRPPKLEARYTRLKKYLGADAMRNFWRWLLNKPERLTALSTFAIFLATAVAVGVGIAQWSALHHTDISIERQLGVMQRQLDAIERDQQPYISIDAMHDPTFELTDANKGWVTWNIPFHNSGKGIARDITINTFISLDDGPFTRSSPLARTEPIRGEQIAAGDGGYFTIASEPTITQSEFDTLKGKDFGISILIEFMYSDSTGKLYEIPACYGLYASGAISTLSIADCKKRKQA